MSILTTSAARRQRYLFPWLLSIQSIATVSSFLPWHPSRRRAEKSHSDCIAHNNKPSEPLLQIPKRSPGLSRCLQHGRVNRIKLNHAPISCFSTSIVTKRGIGGLVILYIDYSLLRQRRLTWTNLAGRKRWHHCLCCNIAWFFNFKENSLVPQTAFLAWLVFLVHVLMSCFSCSRNDQLFQTRPDAD